MHEAPESLLSAQSHKRTMKINRENYPLYFLDHFEGRLSEEGMQELLFFLESHPDLNAEFEAFEMVSIKEEDQMAFPGKESLKKNTRTDMTDRASGEQGATADDLFAADEQGVLRVKPAHVETVLVAFAEGDLSRDQEAAAKEFLSANPMCQRDLKLLLAARLKPEPAAACPRKHALKRYPIGAFVRRWSHTAAAAAAAVLMAVIMWHLAPDPMAPEFTQDSPAGIDRERTEAVAEAPGLQQRPSQAMTARPPQQLHLSTRPDIYQTTTASRLASLQIAPPKEDPDVSGAYAGQGPGTRRESPPMASRINRMMPQVTGGATKRQHASLQKRQEYYWLAYRDRSELFAADPEERPAASRQQVSLAQLARHELEERTGLPIDKADELLHTDVSLFRQYARRGIGSINNLLGHPVVVDGESKPDGRTVTFALGDFFEVSRK